MYTSTKLLIDQHIHGGYGVDLSNADADKIVFLSECLFRHGIGGYFPTLVTDSIENIKRQIKAIKKAALCDKKNIAKILGIHLEGIFINPLKKGIHNPEHFLPATVENYKLVEDDFVKIVTLAPELDEGLIDYLNKKGVKVQAGHCIGADLWGINAATHLFNAMQGISHRRHGTALTALLNDNIYTELICDGVHLNDEIIILAEKIKPRNKIILISDALPIAYSDIKEMEFAGERIYYNGKSATSLNGTIAGSTTLLDKIVKILHNKNLFHSEYIDNVYKYHNINLNGEIIWDTNFDILEVRNE